jgi:hypothetical protein
MMLTQQLRQMQPLLLKGLPQKVGLMGGVTGTEVPAAALTAAAGAVGVALAQMTAAATAAGMAAMVTGVMEATAATAVEMVGVTVEGAVTEAAVEMEAAAAKSAVGL